MTARDLIIDYLSEVIQAKVIVLSKTDTGYLYKFKKNEFEIKIYLFTDYEPDVENDIQCMAHIWKDNNKYKCYHGTINDVMEKIIIFK
jgi:hypothetical protein